MTCTRGAAFGLAGFAVVSASPALATFIWLLIAAINVAWYWGGEPAFADATVATCVLLILFFAGSRRSAPLWPVGLRAQGAVVGTAALLAGVVTIFSGGVYMGDRFATSEHDLGDRIQHWSGGIGFLRAMPSARGG